MGPSLLVVQTFFVLIGLSNTVDNDFTVALAAGKRECYYQVMKKNSDVEVEYQVLDGGDLLLDTTFHSPTGTVIWSDFRNSDQNHKFKVDEDGEYELCFDNGVSSYYDKIVFFEIVVDGEKDDDDDAYFAKIANQDATNDFEQYDKRVEDVKDRLEVYRTDLKSWTWTLELLPGLPLFLPPCLRPSSTPLDSPHPTPMTLCVCASVLQAKGSEKRAAEMRKQPTFMYLVPEFCYMTGLTSKQRTDFTLMSHELSKVEDTKQIPPETIYVNAGGKIEPNPGVTIDCSHAHVQ